MNFEPFCIEIEGLTEQQVKSIERKAVTAGAKTEESVEMMSDYSEWRFYGVDYENQVVFYDNIGDYANSRYEKLRLLTLDQLDAHLGLEPEKHPLRDVKLKVLDNEHSEAFQEAVFASGGRWRSGSTEVDSEVGSALYVDYNGEMSASFNLCLTFDKAAGEEVEFTYERQLTYSINKVTPKVEVLGKLYNKEDVEKAIASIPYQGKPT